MRLCRRRGRRGAEPIAGLARRAIYSYSVVMLLKMGKRSTAPGVAELLLECHERIRRFMGMARSLAAATGAPLEEIRSVAGQVRRYFVESLPLHVADEHDEILPRLAGSSPEVDRALATMDTEHTEHEPLIARLVALCDELVAGPGRLPAVADELRQLGDRLTAELERHLEREEQVIIPAVRQLPTSEREAVLVAMRERRARYLDAAASPARS